MKLKREKINEKDVGLAEDGFEMLIHAVGEESHCKWNYNMTKSQGELDKWIESRELRSELMKLIVDLFGVDLKNQSWCQLKHTLRIAIGIEEVMNRINKNSDKKKELESLAEIHNKIYLRYLSILGVNEKNAKVLSEA